MKLEFDVGQIMELIESSRKLVEENSMLREKLEYVSEKCDKLIDDIQFNRNLLRMVKK